MLLLKLVLLSTPTKSVTCKQLRYRSQPIWPGPKSEHRLLTRQRLKSSQRRPASKAMCSLTSSLRTMLC